VNFKVTRAFVFGAKSYGWFLLPPPKLLPDSGHSTMSVLGEKRHLLAHQYSQRWRQLQRIRSPKTAARDLPNVRLPSILHSEGLFLPGLERKHTARFFGCCSRNTPNRSLPSYSRTHSESARQKQPSIAFQTRVCPQSFTQRIRFCQDLSEITPRIFLGAARATIKTGVSQATRSITAIRLDKNNHP
jgi:hypothetical protein